MPGIGKLLHRFAPAVVQREKCKSGVILKIYVCTYISLRPSIAFSIVISSVYSMSLPTGMPMAMRVTFTPAALELLREIGGGGFAFDGGIGGDNDFVDIPGVNAA